MDEIPYYRKPWFNSIILTIILLGIYIYNIFWQGGFWANIPGIILDLILLFLLYQACVFFYAQFILPIHSWENRNKIVSRLWLHTRNDHGPAIFVKNGRKVESVGESDRRGPGVLWVDTASAVVTRTFITFKQVLGPGVHFIESNEHIASIISLHTQTQVIGPARDDNPYEKLKDNPSPEDLKKYQELRSRCMAVRAMTRDGIEVYPNLSVTFKIDAKPAAPGKNGSHFGFNAEAVEKAARSEGINPNTSLEDKRRVEWNQLPALIAVDLAREYLSKFTLSELFDPSHPRVPDIPQPETPPAYVQMPKTPLVIRRGFAVRVLRNINNSFEKKLDQLIPKEEIPDEEALTSEVSDNKKMSDPKKQTALQIINQMMKARLTRAVVAKLDECGTILEGFEASSEYKKLKDRGVAIINVSINKLHFSPIVESRFLEHWNTSWLAQARKDQNRIERLNTAYTQKGRQRADLDIALDLSQAVIEENPSTIPATVKTLLYKTQNEIKLNERLNNRMRSDLESLDDLIKWIEIKGV